MRRPSITLFLSLSAACFHGSAQEAVVKLNPPFTATGGRVEAFELTSEGKSLVMTASLETEDKYALYVCSTEPNSAPRRLIPFDLTPRKDLEDFSDEKERWRQFWIAPDQRSVLFLHANGLWRVPIEGGIAQQIYVPLSVGFEGAVVGAPRFRGETELLFPEMPLRTDCLVTLDGPPPSGGSCSTALSLESAAWHTLDLATGFPVRKISAEDALANSRSLILPYTEGSKPRYDPSGEFAYSLLLPPEVVDRDPRTQVPLPGTVTRPREVWRRNLTDGKERRVTALTALVGDADELAASANGRWVAYGADATVAGRRDIFLLDRASDAPPRRIVLPQPLLNPRVSAVGDAGWVVVDDPSGLYLVPSATGEARWLGKNQLWVNTNVEGTIGFFYEKTGFGREIWAVPTDGSGTPLAMKGSVTAYLTYRPPRVAYGRGRLVVLNVRDQLHVVDALTGLSRRRLSETAPGMTAINEQSGAIAWTEGNRVKLLRHFEASIEEVATFSLFSAPGFLQFRTPAGESPLAFVPVTGNLIHPDGFGFRMHDIATGQNRVIAEPKETIDLRATSPDGLRFAWTEGTARQESLRLWVGPPRVHVRNLADPAAPVITLHVPEASGVGEEIRRIVLTNDRLIVERGHQRIPTTNFTPYTEPGVAIFSAPRDGGAFTRVDRQWQNNALSKTLTGFELRGRHVFYRQHPRHGDEEARLFRVETDGSGWTPITQAGHVSRFIAPAHGREVYFLSSHEHPGRFEVYAFRNAPRNDSYEAWAVEHFSRGEGELPSEDKSRRWGQDADPDGDGLANVLEAFAGSDPKSVNVNPVFGATRLSPERMEIWIRQSPREAALLRLEHSNNLRVWSDRGDLGTSKDGRLSFEVYVPPGSPYHFLRFVGTPR